jgi:hypothetical protein
VSTAKMCSMSFIGIYIISFSRNFFCFTISLGAARNTKARQAASSSYLPIIFAINGIYLFLRLVYQRSLISFHHLLATIILVVLSVVSYKGILDDHAKTISKGKGRSGEALAGGASLDLLGLVSIVQYGSVFVSTKIYWLLVLIPLWRGWIVSEWGHYKTDK